MLRKEQIEDVAKSVAIMEYTCDGSTKEDYDRFMESPEEFTIWETVQYWPISDVQDQVEILKENVERQIERYVNGN